MALYICAGLYLRVMSLSFVLFNDTWSQFRHLLSCMTISLLWLRFTRLDIRPHVTWAAGLLIVGGQFIFLRSFCGYVWVVVLTYQL